MDINIKKNISRPNLAGFNEIDQIPEEIILSTKMLEKLEDIQETILNESLNTEGVCTEQTQNQTQNQPEIKNEDVDNKDKQINGKSKDTAQLSKPVQNSISKIYGEGPDGWTLDVEDSWNKLLGILRLFPSEKGLQEQFQILERLYLPLQKTIVNNLDGDGHIRTQSARLDSALSAAVNIISKSSLSGVFSFFNEYGPPQLLTKLKESIFFNITGQMLSSRDLKEFWKAGEDGVFRDVTGGKRPLPQVKSPLKQEMPAFEKNSGRSSSPSSGLPGGPSGGTPNPAKSPAHAAYLKNVPSPKEQMFSMDRVNERPGIQSAFSSMPGKSLFTAHDMEKAEVFFEHIVESTNGILSLNPDDWSEPDLGFLKAFITVKCRHYADYAGFSKQMKEAVETVVKRMADYEIVRLEKSINKPGYYLKQSNIQKFYNEVVNDNTWKDGLVSPSGIKTFAETFYHKNAGQIPQADLEKTLKFMEKDWKQFLSLLGGASDHNFYKSMDSQSPWGMFWFPFFPLGKSNILWVATGILVVILLMLVLNFK